MSDCGCHQYAENQERKTLWLLLKINGVMFFGEFLIGYWANSMAVMADSLDMLADMSVYGISLYAVGRSQSHKRWAAGVSGIAQIGIALWILMDALRRFQGGEPPNFKMMISISALALIANSYCLYQISRYRHRGIHLRASWIFSQNDVIANLGVLMTAILVRVFESRWPDLVVGLLIAIVVILGGFRILHSAWQTDAARSN